MRCVHYISLPLLCRILVSSAGGVIRVIGGDCSRRWGRRTHPVFLVVRPLSPILAHGFGIGSQNDTPRYARAIDPTLRHPYGQLSHGTVRKTAPSPARHHCGRQQAHCLNNTTGTRTTESPNRRRNACCSPSKNCRMSTSRDQGCDCQTTLTSGGMRT
jgi:hypothetical protein